MAAEPAHTCSAGSGAGGAPIPTHTRIRVGPFSQGRLRQDSSRRHGGTGPPGEVGGGRGGVQGAARRPGHPSGSGSDRDRSWAQPRTVPRPTSPRIRPARDRRAGSHFSQSLTRGAGFAGGAGRAPPAAGRHRGRRRRGSGRPARAGGCQRVPEPGPAVLARPAPGGGQGGRGPVLPAPEEVTVYLSRAHVQISDDPGWRCRGWGCRRWSQAAIVAWALRRTPNGGRRASPSLRCFKMFYLFFGSAYRNPFAEHRREGAVRHPRVCSCSDPPATGVGRP